MKARNTVRPFAELSSDEGVAAPPPRGRSREAAFYRSEAELEGWPARPGIDEAMPVALRTAKEIW